MGENCNSDDGLAFGAVIRASREFFNKDCGARESGDQTLPDALARLVEAVQAVDRLTPDCKCGHRLSHRAGSMCPPFVVDQVLVKMSNAVGFTSKRIKARAVAESVELIEKLRGAPGWRWRFDPERGSIQHAVSWELHSDGSASGHGVGYIRCGCLGWELIVGSSEGQKEFIAAGSPEEATDAFRERMVKMCGVSITDDDAGRLIAEVAGRIAQWVETNGMKPWPDAPKASVCTCSRQEHVADNCAIHGVG